MDRNRLCDTVFVSRRKDTEREPNIQRKTVSTIWMNRRQPVKVTRPMWCEFHPITSCVLVLTICCECVLFVGTFLISTTNHVYGSVLLFGAPFSLAAHDRYVSIGNLLSEKFIVVPSNKCQKRQSGYSAL